MGLKEIDLSQVAVPGSGQGMSFAPLVQEFADSGMKAAEIEDTRTPSTVLQGIRAYLANHPDLDDQFVVKSRGSKDEEGKAHVEQVILVRRDALKNRGYTKAQLAKRAEAAGNGSAAPEAEAPAEAPAEAEATGELPEEFADVNIP